MKARKKVPNKELLNKIFRYVDGKLFWKISTSKKQLAGKIAGYKNSNNRWVICIDGKNYYRHRLVYMMHRGNCPTNLDVDHLDTDKTNDRIENLALKTRSYNKRNVPINSNNTSGFTGVYKRKDTGKWQAQITVNGKNTHLGYFDSFEDAVEARKRANVDNGFSELHGSVKIE